MQNITITTHFSKPGVLSHPSYSRFGPPPSYLFAHLSPRTIYMKFLSLDQGIHNGGSWRRSLLIDKIPMDNELQTKYQKLGQEYQKVNILIRFNFLLVPFIWKLPMAFYAEHSQWMGNAVNAVDIASNLALLRSIAVVIVQLQVFISASCSSQCVEKRCHRWAGE